jgi:hypothetical protein
MSGSDFCAHVAVQQVVPAMGAESWGLMESPYDFASYRAEAVPETPACVQIVPSSASDLGAST